MECRGINGTTKRKVINVFKMFQLLTLMKTKLKRNGEALWCGVNGIIAGVQEMERAGEGIVVLLNDVWHSAVIDFGYSSFQGLKFVWWWGMVKKGRSSGGQDCA